MQSFCNVWSHTPIGSRRTCNRFLNRSTQPFLLWLILMLLIWLGPPVAGLHAAENCTPHPDNLVAWWPGDDHVFDIIDVYDGLLENGAGYAPGKVCQAFSLDGVDDRVLVLESWNTDPSAMTRWTIEAWVKPASFTNALYPTIFSEGDRVVALGVTADGNLDSWINGANQLVGTVPLTLNEWNHVAVTFDGIQRRLYVHGQLAGSDTPPRPRGELYDDAAIGSLPWDNPWHPFAGEIDEVTLYDRALSQAEIQAIVDADSAGKAFREDPLPIFLIDPESQIAYLDTTVTLSALAVGCGCETYQWLFNGSPIEGATDRTLTLTNITFADDGEYAVVASNDSGSTTSAVARLTVKFCVDVPPGLVSWWPADGSGLDAVSTNHGAVWNVSYAPGIAGSAFSFSGSDSYVAIEDAPELSPHVGTNAEMTVEAWVKLSQLPSGSGGYVLAKGDAGRWEYGLRIDSAGVPNWHVWSPDGKTNTRVSGGQMLLDRWHYLVATLKKGEFSRIYVDGERKTEVTVVTNETAEGATPLYLGRRSDGYFLNALVDEVAIYNRALTDEEILAHYEGGRFGKCWGGETPAPQFVVQPQNQSGYYFLNAGLSALALGTPRPEYQWYRSNATEWVELPGETNATLAFANLGETNIGHYKVRATNTYGIAMSEAAYLDVVCHDIVCAPPYGEDWEKGWNGWTTDNYSIWQVGPPRSGPEGAHHAENAAATVLNGNYPDDRSSWLISPPFVVPDADELPRLRFWQWYSFSCDDYSRLYIRTVGGSWEQLAQYSGHSGGVWSRPSFDLTRFARQVVQIGFYLYSHNADYGGCCGACYDGNPDVSSGWYLDEVVVVAGPMEEFPPNVAETFEDGQTDWYVTSGTWEIGAGVGHPGQGAKTRLNGNYYDDTSSSLVSPWFDVPSADEQPRLRFWQYFSFSCEDYGELFIRTNAGSWTSLSRYSGHSGAVWSRPSFDLRDYANTEVQLRFLFVSRNADYGGCCGACYDGNPDVSSGWYVDEVTVVAGPVRGLPETFEDGLGDWYVSRGTWEVGRPTSGPNHAHSGSTCAATVLRGNYVDDTSSYLVSPPFLVPPASQNPVLAFNHWYSFSCDDLARVRIWNGTNWSTLAEYTGARTTWEPRVEHPLTAYAAQTVRIGLYFYSHNADYGGCCGSCYDGNVDVSSGWYVDDVFVKLGNLAVDPISAQEINETNSFGLPSCLEFPVTVTGTVPGSRLSFSLLDAPDGATINSRTGQFKWCPSECQGPGTYRIPVYVVDRGNNNWNDLQVVTITVKEVNEQPWMVPSVRSVDVGDTLEFKVCAGDPDCPANALKYTILNSGEVPGAAIDNAGMFSWTPALSDLGRHEVAVKVCDQGSPEHCVTVTNIITVTTNSTCFLDVQAMPDGGFEFTIVDGRTDVDYELEQAYALCSCPCETQWEYVKTISPAEEPITFQHKPDDLADHPYRFFRVKEKERVQAQDGPVLLLGPIGSR